MKRRMVLMFLFLTFPCFAFLNVWQTYRYEKLRTEISKLETEQREWLEQNKRLIAGLEVLRSPERIENLAVKELGLTKPDPEKVLQIRFSRAAGREEF